MNSKKIPQISIEEINLDILSKFLELKSLKNVPEEIVYYVRILEKINAMLHRADKFGSRQAIVNHLLLTENISKHTATRLYYEAIEYFYADKKVSKAAYRNMYAEKLEKLLDVALISYESAGDLRGIAALFKELRALRKLDEDDVTDENALEQKPLQIFTIKPEDVGLDSIDRRLLTEKVNALPEINEITKQKILRDANVKTPKLFTEDKENPYKAE